MRTVAYVVLAMALSLLIGYPVAYYAARHAGRWRALVLLLLVLPFWINYLMRMLAWINLLSPGGWGTRFLHDFGIEALFEKLGLLSQDGGWLNGQSASVVIALVYGYVPFFILPLYAALDRIDQRHIEAARDLGASPFAAFRRVTLPLSTPGILAGRRADRTADVRRLLHERPHLGLAAHDDDRQPDRRVHAAGLPEDRGRCPHDAARALPPGADVLLPAHDPPGRSRACALMAWLRNPWGRPRFLPLIAAIYIFWSIVPVAIAIVFAFNSSRSRTSWDGFSMRWFYGDPDLSVWNDPALQGALKHTLLLAVICVAVATPLGVALALGLQRWRGRGSGSVNVLMLLPLVTPEIVMGVALLLLFLQVFSAIGIGTTTQSIGQVTFTVSYVVVMVRGRLVSIGPEYEEAAADLGAPPFGVLWRVLLPLLAPAILASAAVVFALSIDDFVVTQYLSGDASTTTVSMLLYSSARGAPTPALNALATIAL